MLKVSWQILLTLDLTLPTDRHCTITCEDHFRSSARHRLNLHLLILILFKCANKFLVLLLQVLNDALLLRVFFHQHASLLFKVLVDRQVLSSISQAIVLLLLLEQVVLLLDKRLQSNVLHLAAEIVVLLLQVLDVLVFDCELAHEIRYFLLLPR